MSLSEIKLSQGILSLIDTLSMPRDFPRYDLTNVCSFIATASGLVLIVKRNVVVDHVITQMKGHLHRLAPQL